MLSLDDELDIEDKITEIMRKLSESANVLINTRKAAGPEDDDDEDDDE